MTTVTAVLVSHDGARWLPRVLRHLDDLTIRPDRLVAVDTGSADGSADLLREHVPAGSVLETGPVGFGAAVAAALRSVPPSSGTEWVWLLHDDSAPAPDALERLLAGTAPPADTGARPAAVLGPKTREWPSLRRLLEVGATVSGTGRREVGLERGEYDQGQHDQPRDVLAVGTAGMLVRRDVLEEVGFDDDLPVTWSDLDFGWRVNRAGYGVRTVPAAVVFHADATRTGRRSPASGRATRRRVDRAGAARTLLANTSGPRAVPTSARLMVGGLLRFLGLLLVRAPAEAWGELTALPAVFLRPGRLLRARRARRATARLPHAEVRGLLAPWWTPYRHGLDELSDIGEALLHEVRGDRPGGAASSRTLLLRPALLLFLLLVVASLWTGRHHLSDGPGSLPALLPPPGSAWAWWDTYLSTTHQAGLGSTTTAPPYLLPLAVLATVTAASATWATHLVLVLALPLAAVGCHRLLSPFVGPALAVATSVGYALVVAMSGAPAQGRVGTLVAAAVLPWAVAAALDLTAPDPYARRRAVWRTSLWLWLAASFVPAVLPVALVGLAGLALVGTRTHRPVGAALVPVPVTFVLLLPWSALVWSDHGPEAWLAEAGPPYAAGVATADSWGLLLARPAELGGAPAWLSAGVVLLALLALLRRRTRGRVALAWLAAVVALAWAVAVLGVSGGPVWVATPLVAAHGALLVAAALAGTGLREELAGSAFGGRQLVGTLAATIGVATLVGGTVWWVQAPPVAAGRMSLPSYMVSASEEDPAMGVLVLRGRHDSEVGFEVRRAGGPHLGDEALRAEAAAEEAMTGLVTRVVAGPDGEAAAALSGRGVEFVVLPAPVDQVLGAVLDATPGLTTASAGETGARAWRLETDPDLPATTGSATRSWLRPAMLVAQLASLVAVVVLAAPGRRRAG